jgi:hypothetical protein
METVQIASIEKPVDNSAILRALTPVTNRACAMGVPLPGHGRPFSLSARTLKTILESARRFGIGRDIDTYIRAVPDIIERNPEEVARLFGDEEI